MSKQQAKPKPAKKQAQRKCPAAARDTPDSVRATTYISVSFTIYGPFETPIQRKGKGVISFSDVNPGRLFALSGAKAHAADVGCYVMARQFGDSFTPLYVGKTTKNFGREVFDVDKREKYRLAAEEFPNGSFVLFLLIPKPGQTLGRANAIRDLERHLVEKGKQVNPLLQNQRLIPRPTFRIEGIHNVSPGQPRIDVQNFKTMMGYKTKAASVRKS